MALGAGGGGTIQNGEPENLNQLVPRRKQSHEATPTNAILAQGAVLRLNKLFSWRPGSRAYQLSAMQRLLLLVFTLAAAPMALACTEADVNTISTCTNALVLPNAAALADCYIVATDTWNGTCSSALWCPYYTSLANCYPGSCCTAELSATWKSAMDTTKTSNNATCDASAIACTGTASGASGTSPPLAALAATLLALVATRG